MKPQMPDPISRLGQEIQALSEKISRYAEENHSLKQENLRLRARLEIKDNQPVPTWTQPRIPATGEGDDD